MPWGDKDTGPGRGLARDESLRAFYKTLLRIRHQHPSLARGNYSLLSGPQDSLMAYLRSDDESKDSIVVIVNRDDATASADFPVPEGWNDKTAVDELNGERVSCDNGRLKLSMLPKSVRILSLNPGKVVR
jgi:glycosidase